VRRPRLKPTALDIALAGTLGSWAQVMVWRGDVAGERPAIAVLFLLVGWPLVARRVLPTFPLVAQIGAQVTQALATGKAAEGQALLFAGLIALYSVAAWGRRRDAITGLLVTTIGAIVISIEDPLMRTTAQIWAGAFFWLLMFAAWITGLAVRHRRNADAAERHAERLDALNAEAVASERARIARELHDVIAHNVSVVVLQAVAALGVLEGTPERAGEPLRRIEASGREALDELRRLLGVLRDGSQAEEGLTPQPGLADLPALVDSVSGAGVAVALSFEGRPRTLPRGVDLSAYRIVQEALTNTLKHAASAQAVVTVRYTHDAVELRIVDDGAGTANGGSEGNGLAGMRERVTLYGGSLETGPQPDGGFAVNARLPVDDEDTA
jgi:signal transduction histidine kinase